ncbi:MAG TPA: hypothetical protein VKI44_32225 [Acetobacteraceae bacterium]|nr:hypothetical protein [Acetobacteraceae bacterium]
MFAALASLLGGACARADFVISDPAAPEPAGASAGEPSPHPHRVPARTRSVASAGVAQGFGRQVPLSFAVRQIVPPAIHVSYGPDVDTKALVDWSGGALWDQVLRAAIEPLGLRLLIGRGVIELRR